LIKKISIIVSACLGTSGTNRGVSVEQLENCLSSVCGQDYPSLEIIVIDDSGTRALQKQCKNSVKLFQKKNKKLTHIKDIVYICNEKNLGLIESRRMGFENAHGFYTAVVDADDVLTLPTSISKMHEASVYNQNGKDEYYDIVQSAALLTGNNTALINNKDKTQPVIQNPVVQEVIQESNLINLFWGQKPISAYLWAKLYKTEKALEALSLVPNMYCVMAEDLMLSYFFSREMNSYKCIADKLYTYTVNSGITSAEIVTSLERWNQMCSVSSVFTSIMYDLQERPLQKDSGVYEKFRKHYFHYVTGNAFALAHQVDPSIYEQAKALFIEAWGQEPALKAMESVSKM